MNSTLDLLKFKESLGALQVRIESTEEKLRSMESIRQDLSEIKDSLREVYQRVLEADTSDHSAPELRQPKGGKSL